MSQVIHRFLFYCLRIIFLTSVSDPRVSNMTAVPRCGEAWGVYGGRFERPRVKVANICETPQPEDYQ